MKRLGLHQRSSSAATSPHESHDTATSRTKNGEKQASDDERVEKPRPKDNKEWLTSGELFCRSDFYGSKNQERWQELFRPFQEMFGDLDLKNDQASLEVKVQHDHVEKDLNAAKDTVKRGHDHRLRVISARLHRFEESVESMLQKVELEEDYVRQKVMDKQTRLDNKLLTYCAQYGATIEKEMQVVARRLLEEQEGVKRKVEELKCTLDMEEFALHLEHETNGQVILKKLSKDNPQYVRCTRACVENVKSDFFDTESLYSGIAVEEVFKLENRAMLRAFQQRAAKLKPGSVKGLFCTIPENCIEKILVQGMMTTNTDIKEEGGDPAASLGNNNVIGRALFSKAQYNPCDEDRKKLGVAEQRYLDAQDVPFPCTFSRYSTLEADRALMSSQDAINQTRYLLLCRVIIGDTFLTSNDYKGFPRLDASNPRGKFDSMFSAAQEEYLMLNAKFILPEFLIRFQYKARYGPESTATKSNSGGMKSMGVFEPDLSTPLLPGKEMSSIDDNNPMQQWIPRGVGVPNPYDTTSARNYNTKEAETQRQKLRDFVMAAEVQAGVENVHQNAKTQREYLWAKIAQTLLE